MKKILNSDHEKQAHDAVSKLFIWNLISDAESVRLHTEIDKRSAHLNDSNDGGSK